MPNKKKNLKSNYLLGAFEGAEIIDPKRDASFNIGKVGRNVIKVCWTIAALPAALSFHTTTTYDDSMMSQVILNNGTTFAPQIKGDNNTLHFNLSPTSTGCEVKICDTFDDQSKWTKHPNLEFTNTGDKQIRPLLSGNQRGGEMYYKDIVLQANFTALVSITPCGARQANVRLLYGDSFDGFEYIIGDANYSRIAIKASGNKYIAPKGYATKHYKLPEQIEPCTPIQIKLDVSLNDNKIVLDSCISYVSVSGKSYDQLEVPRFSFSTPHLVWTIQNQFGIGLSDWQKQGDISAKLNYLQIDSIKL